MIFKHGDWKIHLKSSHGIGMGTSFYNKILKILAAWSATEGSEINMATLLQMQMGSIPWEASKMDVH
jgi:hypothetical protein